jgi:hypothetical protein
MDNLQTKEHWTENTAHRHKKHTDIKNTEQIQRLATLAPPQQTIFYVIRLQSPGLVAI